MTERRRVAPVVVRSAAAPDAVGLIRDPLSRGTDGASVMVPALLSNCVVDPGPAA